MGLRLLVLLWAWALLMLVVVDLFLNVDELDNVRPRAPLYRGMRRAAHGMVGERYWEADVSGPRAPAGSADTSVRTPGGEDGSRSPPAPTYRATAASAAELLPVLGAETEDPRALHVAMADLVALVRASPEAALDVMRSIEKGECSDLAAGRMLTCLAAAGTDACQRAVLGILENRELGLERRRQALRSLSTVRTPARAVDAALARLVEERGPLAGEALETWAIVAERAREEDPARFEPVAARVRELLETAHGPEQLRRVLRVTAHLGWPDVPTRVLDAATETDEGVRAAAMRALRRIDSPDADGRLLRSLREDRSEGVRRAALEALAFRQREGRLETDTLATASRAALRAAAEADPSPRIRRRAAQVLSRLDS
ncbi:MAG: HEAT repeat domain-containing protein [Planctomycetota bacterium]